ncbi:MAG: hypothetical protein KAI83_07150 [Thiomargarita sp.]|nr:hypothetical protein [Thiomargarita sp.]
MYIGIIAEGKSDLAVIRNILKGKISIDTSDIMYLQPELDFDETDLHNMSKEQFSNWVLVKQACLEKKKLADFFSVEEERYIILQIDTAEVEEINYEVKRPKKHANPDYSRVLRNNVVDKINEWLENQFSEQIFYAIAIEETEAWVLTIYTNKKGDTCRHNDPKMTLDKVLNEKFSEKDKNKILKNDNKLEKFDKLSKKFGRKKDLMRYVKLNESLKLFCDSLEKLM